jgi:hypothetical protein
MGRAIISEFKTIEEAKAYLECMEDFGIHKDLDRFIIDDTTYNGKYTVNVE